MRSTLPVVWNGHDRLEHASCDSSLPSRRSLHGCLGFYPSIGYIDETHDHGVAEGSRARCARPGPSSIVGNVDQWRQVEVDDENTVLAGEKLWRGHCSGPCPL